MAGVLVCYGALLAALSILLKLDKGYPLHLVAFAGLAAAVLSMGLGIGARTRHHNRTWPVLVLIATAVVFLMQTIHLWWEFFARDVPVFPVLLSSLCLLLTFGVLIYVLYAERPPGYWTGRRESAPGNASSN